MLPGIWKRGEASVFSHQEGDFCHIRAGVQERVHQIPRNVAVQMPFIQLRVRKSRFEPPTNALKSFFCSSQASTFNCEMSDLDQSELKIDIHYTHTPSRDNWLFAWNPFDYTCRDKITSLSGNRINNERRMDIFRDTGKLFNRTSVLSSPPASTPISHNLSNNSQTKLTTSSSSSAQ